MIRSSFCIPKVIRIGVNKGANYSPTITISVNLGTLLNKVFGPQKSIFNHLVLVCSILSEKLENLLLLGGDSDFPCLHLHNVAKRQLPEEGVWRVVSEYYFRHGVILLSVSGYDISCLPWARSRTRICLKMSTEKDLNFTTVFRHYQTLMR